MSTIRPATHRAACAIIALLLPLAPASAQSLAERPSPTGDWYGLRSTLLTHGVALHATYTSDVVSNLSGGINRRTIYVGNLDLTLTCHLQALTGVPAGTLFIYGIADPDVDQFLSYTGAGAVHAGLIPGRDGDTVGFAVAAAHNGDPVVVKLKSPGPHNRAAVHGANRSGLPQGAQNPWGPLAEEAARPRSTASTRTASAT